MIESPTVTEEAYRLKQKDNIEVYHIIVDEETFSKTVLPDQRFKHTGDRRGRIFNIPVACPPTYDGGYKIKKKVLYNACDECGSHMLFDETFNEHYCPFCDEEGWVQKKRRKIFTLLGKL